MDQNLPENKNQEKQPEVITQPPYISPVGPNNSAAVSAITASQPERPHWKSPIFITVWLVIILLVTGGGVFGLSYFHKTKPSNNVTSSNKSAVSVQPPTVATGSSQITNNIPLASGMIDPTKIPLGDKNVSSVPKVGDVYSCQTNFNASAGGAQVDGPWINTAADTWNSKTKVAVSGAVHWPSASYAAAISGSQRNITGNDLPINGQTTGVFPIAATDKAYSYDRNPNTISAQSVSLSLPVSPSAANTPGCLPGGMIGVLSDGVALFDALDGEGRDAAAHETLDTCDGHPEKTGQYHHHDIPSCIMVKAEKPSSSTLVGYATDGYGIYVERDKNGNLLTNANLDACHGRTGYVMWDGDVADMYHYVATTEFPYTVGCFHGTPTLKQALSNAP